MGSGGGGGFATILIPARLASERLPRKPLLAETGHPLIWHVVEAARRAACAREVVVATDSGEIVEAVEGRGGRTVMTSADHPNGTSRLAEAAAILGLGDEEVVVNVQGDEPEIEGEVIDACARALASTGAAMATVASPFSPDEDPNDPSIVKVVVRADGMALYFSRSLIPHDRGTGDTGDETVCVPLKHIGLYAYSAGFLRRYVGLEPTPLERTERLEQLRVLEHGLSIGVARCTVGSAGIDTEAQYAAFVARSCASEST
ncbi:MAG: 3-deoxy-manno-octulosonate cytidylyltransferase [Planctomycetota bacterium]